MANKYITINEGTGGLNKRFKAVQMTPNIRFSRSIETTVGGDYDVSYGNAYEACGFVLRVPWYSADSNYGTYKDLIQMLRRNDPGATPSPMFTFTDHYGTAHTGARFGMDGVTVEPLTTMIDTNGPESSYMIQVNILLAPGDKIVPTPT